MSGHSARIRFLMACGHDQLVTVPAPNLGALHLCIRCDDYRIVTDIPDYWVGICRQFNCWYRIYTNEVSVIKAADKHCRPQNRIRMGHAVVIRHGGRPIREFDPNMGEWFDRLDPAQRRALVKGADSNPTQGLTR